MTAPHHLESFPFTVLMDWILTKLGFNKIKINAADLQKKLGLLGEPMMIGLFVGLLIGLIGEAPFLFGENALTAWGTALGVAINTAAIMAVFPKVAAIFASAFTSMSDAYKSRAAASAKERRWFLSVNDACGYGETNTLVTGVLLIPIMLVLAFILQPLGNNVLPMADLCALPYMVEVFVCVSNGNIAKSVVMGAIWFGIGLLLFSQLAPTFTQVAVGTGQFTVPEGALNVCSFGIVCHPFMIALFYVFWKGGIVAIAVAVVLYVVLYVWFRKNKQKVYDYLENNAAAYQA